MSLSLPSRSKGRPRVTAPELRTTVILSDMHIPEMDMAAYNATLHFIRDKRPDFLFINGDMLDMHSFSSFLHDPALDHRTQESLDQANAVLDQLAEASPNTIIKFIAGNHEMRLIKYLYGMPEILPFVTKGKSPLQILADALSLDDRGIDWYGYPEVVNFHGFYITHGEATGLHAAKKELETHSVSGTSGHCHSNKYWERRGRNGVLQWWSIGGLCSRDVSYRPNNSWVQGMGYLTQVVGTDIFDFTPIPIVKGQFIYDGVLYNQDGKFETR
jgi:predicted phosphodiesterase